MPHKKKKAPSSKSIKPRGGVAGRQNKNMRTQIDEYGNPKTPKKKKK